MKRHTKSSVVVLGMATVSVVWIALYATSSGSQLGAIGEGSGGCWEYGSVLPDIDDEEWQDVARRLLPAEPGEPLSSPRLLHALIVHGPAVTLDMNTPVSSANPTIIDVLTGSTAHDRFLSGLSLVRTRYGVRFRTRSGGMPGLAKPQEEYHENQTLAVLSRWLPLDHPVFIDGARYCI